MATFGPSTIEAIGASGSALVVLGYGLVRMVSAIVDRVVFLIGLRMILRTTTGKTRETVLLAYVEHRQHSRRKGMPWSSRTSSGPGG